jgi:hypothetical protein
MYKPNNNSERPGYEHSNLQTGFFTDIIKANLDRYFVTEVAEF